jgi:hypothetical protein
MVSSVRPVWSISQNTIWTSPLDMSRRVDQDSFVARQNRSPDEGDMSYTNLHAKSTGALTGLVGAPRFRVKSRFCKRISLRARPPHPINIKGHGRLRFIIQSIKYIYLLLSRTYFYLQTLALLISSVVLPSSPRRLKPFLEALPILEQPYVRLPDGMLPGRRSEVFRRFTPAKV